MIVMVRYRSAPSPSQCAPGRSQPLWVSNPLSQKTLIKSKQEHPSWAKTLIQTRLRCSGELVRISVMSFFGGIFGVFSKRPEANTKPVHDVPQATRNRVLIWCRELFSNSRQT